MEASFASSFDCLIWRYTNLEKAISSRDIEIYPQILNNKQRLEAKEIKKLIDEIKLELFTLYSQIGENMSSRIKESILLTITHFSLIGVGYLIFGYNDDFIYSSILAPLVLMTIVRFFRCSPIKQCLILILLYLIWIGIYWFFFKSY